MKFLERTCCLGVLCTVLVVPLAALPVINSNDTIPETFERAAAGSNPLLSKLACNRDVVEFEPWSSFFGSYRVGADLEIPCGKGVLLDRSSSEPEKIGTLMVTGSLKIEDDSDKLIQAQNILIQGNLEVGNPLDHISSKVNFRMLKGGSDLIHNRDDVRFELGYKAFIVLGGQVRLYGLPGGNACTDKTWTNLAKHAKKGDSSITVDNSVADCWKVGHSIGIAASYKSTRELEERVISKLTRLRTNTVLDLTESLEYDHLGNDDSFEAGGRTVTQTSEVGLLTRNIVVDSETESQSTRKLDGMHVMVAHTTQTQIFSGVEFVGGGQQGRLGRYPIHFHLCEDSSGSLVEACSIRDSLQRGIVIHGTDRVEARWNVAFNNVGHVIMNEDGVEMGNKFIENAVMGAFKPKKVIKKDGKSESDKRASCFWISNPGNTLVGNVASSCNIAYWYELEGKVRGASTILPQAKTMDPKKVAIEEFKDNRAHSSRSGLLTYPGGMLSKSNKIENFQSHNVQKDGIFHHNGAVTIIGGIVSDSGEVGIDLDRVHDTKVVNTLVVGRGPNGKECPSEYGIALSPSVFIQGLGKDDTDLEGVTFDKFVDCKSPLTIVADVNKDGNRFNDFNPVVPATTAITDVDFGDSISRGFFLRGIEKDKQETDWMRHIAVEIKGGNLFSGDSGYLVSDNNPMMIPPQSGKCLRKAELQAYFCQDVCYRTVMFSFSAPGDRDSRDWKLLIERDSDGALDSLSFPKSNTSKRGGLRYIFVSSLLAEESYAIRASAPGGGKAENLLIEPQEGSQPCLGEVEVRFPEN